MWELPGPGLEPVSPALAGGFLTSTPPGKPYLVHSLPSPHTRIYSLTTRMYASYVHHFILVAQSTHFSSNDAAYGGVFIMKDSKLVEKAEIWQWLMQGLHPGFVMQMSFHFIFGVSVES